MLEDWLGGNVDINFDFGYLKWMLCLLCVFEEIIELGLFLWVFLGRVKFVWNYVIIVVEVIEGFEVCKL